MGVRTQPYFPRTPTIDFLWSSTTRPGPTFVIGETKRVVMRNHKKKEIPVEYPGPEISGWEV